MSLQLWILTGGTLVVLFVLFAPLERAFPARRQRVFRREWLTDLCFFAGQFLLFNGLVIGLLALLAEPLGQVLPAGVREGVATWPFALQALLAILLCDVTIYWGHRLSHRVDFLWRFHRVHHTAERLDFMAAYREHPLDGLYTVTLENLPILLLGFPLEAIAGFVIFRGLWAVFIHSNVRLPLGPLEVLLGSPRLHHWHHDREKGLEVNFANLSPLMDVLFGTYYRGPEGAQPDLGTDERVPRGYLSQLAYPLLPAALRRRIWPQAPGTPERALPLPPLPDPGYGPRAVTSEGFEHDGLAARGDADHQGPGHGRGAGGQFGTPGHADGHGRGRGGAVA